MTEITVIKLNLKGQETWRYEGQVLERTPTSLVLHALFNAPDRPFMGTSLKRGDRFVEVYFTDRWYNVFEIHDRADGRLKAWYCNVGRPAVIQDGEVSYEDLALDLLVYPDGRQLVLDEDEFAALPLSEEDRQKCRLL